MCLIKLKIITHSIALLGLGLEELVFVFLLFNINVECPTTLFIHY